LRPSEDPTDVLRAGRRLNKRWVKHLRANIQREKEKKLAISAAIA
jgi:hypothetical protein